MLQLTTDKHEASRGLSATSELLVKFGTNNTMHNLLEDWWSVKCCQQILTVECIDNVKHQTLVYSSGQ